MKTKSATLILLMLYMMLFSCGPPAAGQVAVRHTEGLVHGFLVLRSTEGKTLAHGELKQLAHGSRVTSHLVFHFSDGSVRDETATYSQRQSFQLLRYHLVQKGPSFPHPEDLSIDVSSGQLTYLDSRDDGKSQVKTEHMRLPADLANGMTFTLLKNVQQGSDGIKASMIVSTPKPRLVKLAISAQGEDSFLLGSEKHKATHYVAKIELGGVTGLVAPLIGKEPPDIHIWILRGEAPAFLKSSGPLFSGGPIWEIALESPVWPSTEGKDK